MTTQNEIEGRLRQVTRKSGGGSADEVAARIDATARLTVEGWHLSGLREEEARLQAILEDNPDDETTQDLLATTQQAIREVSP